MDSFIRSIDPFFSRLTTPFIPLVLLFTRLWVAWVFFKSGMIKYSSWDSTLYLFEYEYHVPLLPWHWAAYIGTAVEVFIPIFLTLGLFTRPMALVLFGFNIMAVVSYPVLWEKGFYDHQLWGMMLLINVIWGAGSLSFDHFFNRGHLHHSY